jgi:hypothetical protein
MTNISASTLNITASNTLQPIFITSNLNNELEVVNQNLNTGATASADYVAVNASGSYLTDHYVDLGINGPGYAVPNFVGGPNDAYLFSTASNFFIGNITPSQSLYLFAGGTNSTSSLRLDYNGNLSGSKFVGTSSYAVSASWAPSGGAFTLSTWGTLTYSNPITWSANNSTYEDRQILALSGSTTMSISGLTNGWAGVLKVVNTGSNLKLILPTGTKVAYGGTGSINLTNGISGSVTDFVAFNYDGTTLYANVANQWT